MAFCPNETCRISLFGPRFCPTHGLELIKLGCLNCGSELTFTNNYCTGCGARVREYLDNQLELAAAF